MVVVYLGVGMNLSPKPSKGLDIGGIGAGVGTVVEGNLEGAAEVVPGWHVR